MTCIVLLHIIIVITNYMVDLLSLKTQLQQFQEGGSKTRWSRWKRSDNHLAVGPEVPGSPLTEKKNDNQNTGKLFQASDLCSTIMTRL